MKYNTSDVRNLSYWEWLAGSFSFSEGIQSVIDIRIAESLLEKRQISPVTIGGVCRFIYVRRVVAGLKVYKVAENYENYLQDESKMRGEADSISFPESEEEVKETLRYCREHELTITVQGGKTGLSGGAVPCGGHIMNMSHMNKVKGMRVWNDKHFLTVEAGITLEDLNRYLISSGGKYRWVPSPTEKLSTVGGVISNNAKGIRSYHYGETIDYIDNVKIVFADGSVDEIDQGHRGRELRLLTGSEGTVGVITEATLILTERPEDIWGIAFFFYREEDAWSCIDAIRGKNLTEGCSYLTSMEYLDKMTMDLIAKHQITSTKLQALPRIDEQYRAMLYLELEGHEEEIMGLAEQLMEIASQYGSNLDDSWALSGENELEKMEAFRHAAPEVIGIELELINQRTPGIYKLTGDFQFKTWDTVRILKLYQEKCQGIIRYCVFGHAGSKHFLLNMLPETWEEFQKSQQILQEIAKEVQKDGGRIAGEQGIGKVRRQYLIESDGYGDLQAYKKLKDPEKIWNIKNIF